MNGKKISSVLKAVKNAFIYKLNIKKDNFSVDERKLDDCINYLESRPEIRFNPYPEYDAMIYESLDILGFDDNYAANHEKAAEKSISEMNFTDIRAELSFIKRSERFCDGSIAGYVNDGTLLSLLLRLKEIC